MLETLPLDTLRVETFAPLVGSRFELVVGDVRLPIELEEARATGAAQRGYTRAPFTLTFRGPGPQALQQGTYRLEEPALGALEIFLVPVGRDGDGFRYEAVFT